VTYDIYNYISLRLTAYGRLINPLSCLFSRIKSCHEKKSENLSLYFENGGLWKSVGSRTTFRKGDIDLKGVSSDYGNQTKILYRIWKSGELPNFRWTYFTM